MKQDDLARILRKARVPDRPDDYWEAFPGRVVLRLQTEKEVERKPRPLSVAAALAAAAACGLVLGFVFWHRNPAPGDGYGALRDGRVLHELEAQYPGRLQAIIQDGSGLHAQVSDSADVSASDPILLEIRDGKDHRVIVTFSGQLVRCGGKDVVVLSDIGGQVMLVGDGFFWSHHVSAGLAEGIQIRAEKVTGEPAHSKPSSAL